MIQVPSQVRAERPIGQKGKTNEVPDERKHMVLIREYSKVGPYLTSRLCICRRSATTKRRLIESRFDISVGGARLRMYSRVIQDARPKLHKKQTTK